MFVDSATFVRETITVSTTVMGMKVRLLFTWLTAHTTLFRSIGMTVDHRFHWDLLTIKRILKYISCCVTFLHLHSMDVGNNQGRSRGVWPMWLHGAHRGGETPSSLTSYETLLMLRENEGANKMPIYKTVLTSLAKMMFSESLSIVVLVDPVSVH